MSFTPGPWHADGAGMFPGSLAVYSGDHPTHAANICGIWDGGQTYESCVANARLISAAPELYELLRYEVEAGMNNETRGAGRSIFAESLAVLRKANPDYLDIWERRESAKQEER